MGEPVLFAQPNHQAGQARSEDAGEFEERVTPADTAGDLFTGEDLRDDRLTGRGEKAAGQATQNNHPVDDGELSPALGQVLRKEKK